MEAKTPNFTELNRQAEHIMGIVPIQRIVHVNAYPTAEQRCECCSKPMLRCDECEQVWCRFKLNPMCQALPKPYCTDLNLAFQLVRHVVEQYGNSQNHIYARDGSFTVTLDSTSETIFHWECVLHLWHGSSPSVGKSPYHAAHAIVRAVLSFVEREEVSPRA